MSNNNASGSKKEPMRTGAWTRAEQVYAEEVVEGFHHGWLKIKEGTTLRCLLANLLNCDPKRISKRMENTDYKGRKSYQKNRKLQKKEIKAKRAHLRELKVQFEDSLEELRRARLGLFDPVEKNNTNAEEEESDISDSESFTSEVVVAEPAPSATKPQDIPQTVKSASQAGDNQISSTSVAVAADLGAALLRHASPQPSNDSKAAPSVVASTLAGLSNQIITSPHAAALAPTSQQPAPPSDTDALLKAILAKASAGTPETNLLSQIQSLAAPPAPQQPAPQATSCQDIMSLLGGNSANNSVVDAVIPLLMAQNANAGPTNQGYSAPPATTTPDAHSVVSNILKSIQTGATATQPPSATVHNPPVSLPPAQATTDSAVANLLSQLQNNGAPRVAAAPRTEPSVLFLRNATVPFGQASITQPPPPAAAPTDPNAKAIADFLRQFQNQGAPATNNHMPTRVPSTQGPPNTAAGTPDLASKVINDLFNKLNNNGGAPALAPAPSAQPFAPPVVSGNVLSNLQGSNAPAPVTAAGVAEVLMRVRGTNGPNTPSIPPPPVAAAAAAPNPRLSQTNDVTRLLLSSSALQTNQAKPPPPPPQANNTMDGTTSLGGSGGESLIDRLKRALANDCFQQQPNKRFKSN